MTKPRPSTDKLRERIEELMKLTRSPRGRAHLRAILKSISRKPRGRP